MINLQSDCQIGLKEIKLQKKLTNENIESYKLTNEIRELEKKVELLRDALIRVRENKAEELNRAQIACKAEKDILKKIIVKFRNQKEELDNNWQIKLDASKKQTRTQIEERTQIVVSLRERLNIIQEEHENKLADVIKNNAAEKHYLQEIIIHMRKKIFELEKVISENLL